MNILPKKSWHVRTKKNIDRIRRDEAEAERLANLEQDRILQVEQEVRVRELRRRTGEPEPVAKHFDLFEGFQDHQQATNKEYEDEQVREQQRWAERVGISNKLGKSNDVNRPWYCSDRPKANLQSKQGTSNQASRETTDTKSNIIVSMYDPMTAMREAEQIVRLKRAKLREDVSQSNNVKLPITSGENFESSGSGSSPEVVRVVGKSKKTKKSKKKKRSKDKESRSSHSGHRHKHKRHKSHKYVKR